MKKTLTFIFLAALATVGFAQDSSINPNGNTLDKNLNNKQYGIIYFKISAEETQFVPDSEDQIMPGSGFGYRVVYDHQAFDFSGEFNWRQIRDHNGKYIHNFSYICPKINYFYYLTPQNNGSFYVGGGLGFGEIERHSLVDGQEQFTNDDGVVVPAVLKSVKLQQFNGIIANATMGYEFGRLAGVANTFIQFDVNQPTIAFTRDGEFFGPKFSLSAGIGF